MIDEMLLNKILTQAAYENSIERVSYSTGLSVDEICKTLIESKIYHLFPASIMRYLNNNGVSLFDLVAKYGFELHVLAKEFFQHGPEYYHGKTVNYLKIVSHIREKDAVYFVCECLVCGNPEFKIKKYNAINGLTKSCGCLPKGKRIPNEFPIKNETLQPELKALTSELLDKGVLFNNEAKIINKTRKGETSAEKIAIEFNCDSNHLIIAGSAGSYANGEASLTATTSQIFTLSLIDKCILKAQTLPVPIRPANVMGGRAQYCCYITPEMAYDLQTNALS